MKKKSLKRAQAGGYSWETPQATVTPTPVRGISAASPIISGTPQTDPDAMLTPDERMMRQMQAQQDQSVVRSYVPPSAAQSAKNWVKKQTLLSPFAWSLGMSAPPQSAGNDLADVLTTFAPGVGAARAITKSALGAAAGNMSRSDYLDLGFSALPYLSKVARYLPSNAGMAEGDLADLEGTIQDYAHHASDLKDLAMIKRDQFGGTTFQMGGGVLTYDGYRSDSPDKDNPVNVIPSNRISMKKVPHPVIGTDNTGHTKYMMPGGEYAFPGQYVTEVPVKQAGGPIQSGYDPAMGYTVQPYISRPNRPEFNNNPNNYASAYQHYVTYPGDTLTNNQIPYAARQMVWKGSTNPGNTIEVNEYNPGLKGGMPQNYTYDLAPKDMQKINAYRQNMGWVEQGKALMGWEGSPNMPAPQRKYGGYMQSGGNWGSINPNDDVAMNAVNQGYKDQLSDQNLVNDPVAQQQLSRPNSALPGITPDSPFSSSPNPDPASSQQGTHSGKSGFASHSGMYGDYLNAGVNMFNTWGSLIGGINQDKALGRYTRNAGLTDNNFAYTKNDNIGDKGDYVNTGTANGQFRPNQMTPASPGSFRGYYQYGGEEDNTPSPSIDAVLDKGIKNLPDIGQQQQPANPGAILDIDTALKAVASSEGGNLGQRTQLTGSGGKRATASGTYQMTNGTVKDIWGEHFKNQYPSYDKFKKAFDSDPRVEYQAAHAHMEDLSKQYGPYALGAWYYPEYAQKAANGDMSVFNKVPHPEYGNKTTWGDDFNNKMNKYQQYLGHKTYRNGGEYEVNEHELHAILAAGGEVEYL